MVTLGQVLLPYSLDKATVSKHFPLASLGSLASVETKTEEETVMEEMVTMMNICDTTLKR